MTEFIFITNLIDLLIEVTIALTPIILIFIVFQIFLFKLKKKKILDIIKGFALTFFGLVLFLYGVKIGFIPAGNIIGKSLGASSINWLLIPIGFILGFLVTIVEPAIRVLSSEIENFSSGYIKEKTILITLCFGVACSIALAMTKTIFGISLIYLLVPGYTIAFILAIIAGPNFTAIAFDSGGVATGPMVVTFIMSISTGLADVMINRDSILHGFGLVSLVALAPIISVLTLGIIYKIKGGKFYGSKRGQKK